MKGASWSRFCAERKARASIHIVSHCSLLALYSLSRRGLRRDQLNPFLSTMDNNKLNPVAAGILTTSSIITNTLSDFMMDPANRQRVSNYGIIERD